MPKFAVILPAAGKSSRFQDKHYKKPFAPLANRAVWLHSAERFLGRDDVKQLILVISPEDREDFNFKFAANVAILGIDVVEGGAERADSIERALGAREARHRFRRDSRRRPALPGRRMDRPTSSKRPRRAAPRSWPSPCRGTLKRVGRDHTIEETVSRERSVGSANAAGLSPQAAARGLRQARRLSTPPTTPNSSSGSATR